MIPCCCHRPAGRDHLSDRWACGGVALLLALLSGASLQAQVFETVGVRALGMGGAFVAVADDASANYWNPAGVAGVFFSGVLDVQQTDTRLGSDPLGRQGTSHLTTFASLASQSLGLSYYRVRGWQVRRSAEMGDQATLASLVTQHVGLTVLQPVTPGIMVATVLKTVRGTAAVGFADAMLPIATLHEAASELPGRSTTRFDLDFGVMLGADAFKLGFVARNVREPEFVLADDSIVRLRRQLRVGIAIRPSPTLTIASDADLTTTTDVAGPRRNLTLGAEQRLGRVLLRAGGRVNREDSNHSPVGTLGMSLQVTSGFWVDSQFTGGRDEGDRGWGVATRFGV
ncbi:MAG: conjugal transfer protein TraF [Acidobacteriota bacterium]|nr:conjugal transfer protein TraF [Acidobacteriota bacterium]